jgi:hypothetical protein
MKEVKGGQVTRMHSKIVFFLAGFAFLVCTATSRAQTPVSPEFHVNNSNKFPPGYENVGFSKGGEILVVWQSRTPDGNHDGLRGQWFSPTGNLIGKNLLLRVLKGAVYVPVVAPGAHGGALILWHEIRNTQAGYWEVLMGGELLPDGSWFLPPHYITFLGSLIPRFASPLPQGGYAIALLGSRPSHFAENRTFLVFTDDNLKLVRGPSAVSPTRYTSQEVGGLAMRPNGEFLVTWTEAETTILAQLFSPVGRPLAKAFKVPGDGSEHQYAGEAAPLGGDGYVIVWSEDLTSRGIPDLIMRLLKPNGTPQTVDLRLDPEIRFRGLQEVASDSAGNFLVVWQEGGPPDGTWDIWGRLYHPDGTPYGAKVRLNQYTANDQTSPQVASGPNGTFVVIWESSGQDNGYDGVYGRVFAVPASGN